MKLLDELGSPIFTIQYSKEIYPYSFKKPVVTFDIIEDIKIEKEPVIKKVGFNNLEKYGLCIVKIPLDKNERWGRHIPFRIELVRLTNPLATHYRKLLSSYSGSNVIIDEANLKAKLISDRVNKKGESEWMDI